MHIAMPLYMNCQTNHFSECKSARVGVSVVQLCHITIARYNNHWAKYFVSQPSGSKDDVSAAACPRACATNKKNYVTQILQRTASEFLIHPNLQLKSIQICVGIWFSQRQFLDSVQYVHMPTLNQKWAHHLDLVTSRFMDVTYRRDLQKHWCDFGTHCLRLSA